jgi:hypothetical protein
MKRKLMLLLACLFVGIGLVTAQTQKVTGVVISEEDGQPVIGASVLVKGTQIGAITNVDGDFTLLNVPSSAKTLRISFVGMQTQDVAIRPNVRVILKSDVEQLDAKKLVVKNHPNADALNRLIYEFVAAIEKKELELWQQGKRISLELLKDALAARENNSSFISFFKQEVSNSSLKDSTKRNHLSTLLLLQEFKRDIVFSDLTFEFVSSFEYFLQQKGYHTNTIAKHMKHLKRHINIAINKEYIEIQKYAFRKYKIKTVENKHTHLVPEELEQLERLSLTGKYMKLQKSLDAFLFCCLHANE